MKPPLSLFKVFVPAQSVFYHSARTCASDYRLSGLWGSVPASCREGVMLLTLDDLGYTLWGWPDRFIARMKNANVRLIIAEDVVDGRIKGLSDVHQYGDIATVIMAISGSIMSKSLGLR